MDRKSAEKRAIVMLSGGIDSTVALWWARERGLEVVPVSIEFGGRPRRELEAVDAVACAAGLPPVHRMELPFVGLANTLPAYRKPTKPIPYGYIPMRNLLFYTLAAYHADANGARYVVGGHLVDDALGFPDAHVAYFDDLNRLFARSTDGWNPAGPPEIVLPFSGMKKEQVLLEGEKMGVPFGITWSCWLDRDRPCGTCESCKDRAEGFAKAGLTDPAAK